MHFRTARLLIWALFPNCSTSPRASIRSTSSLARVSGRDGPYFNKGLHVLCAYMGNGKPPIWRFEFRPPSTHTGAMGQTDKSSVWVLTTIYAHRGNEQHCKLLILLGDKIMKQQNQ
jgi:hypothetical protein